MRTKGFIASLCLVLISVAPDPADASPDIQSWNTERGAKVMFIENTMLPMVDVRIVYDAADSLMTDGQGCAHSPDRVEISGREHVR